jgi:hypothetical protein
VRLHSSKLPKQAFLYVNGDFELIAKIGDSETKICEEVTLLYKAYCVSDGILIFASY